MSFKHFEVLAGKKMLPEDETWFAKDDRFCRAGVSY